MAKIIDDTILQQVIEAPGLVSFPEFLTMMDLRKGMGSYQELHDPGPIDQLVRKFGFETGNVMELQALKREQDAIKPLYDALMAQKIAMLQGPQTLGQAQSLYPNFPVSPTQQQAIQPMGPGQAIEQPMGPGFIGPGPAVEPPMPQQVITNPAARLAPYQQQAYQQALGSGASFAPGGQIVPPAVTVAALQRTPTTLQTEKHTLEMQQGQVALDIAREDRYQKAMESSLYPDKLIADLDKSRLELRKLQAQVAATQPGSPEQIKLSEEIRHLQAQTMDLRGKAKLSPVVQGAVENAMKQARSAGLQIGGDLGTGMIFGQNFDPKAFARYLRAQILVGMAASDSNQIEQLAKNYEALAQTASQAKPGTAEGYLKNKGVK